MAVDHFKVLAQANPAAGATPLTLYTVPAATQTVASSVVFCNRGPAVLKFRLWVAIAGAADDNKQYLYYDLPLAANDTFVATIGMTLNAGDLVRIQTDTLTLSASLFGTEIS